MKRKMNALVFLSVLFAFSTCNTRQEFAEIQFSSGGCYGECPVFSMKIKNSGEAFYHAEHFNKEKGHFKTTVSPATLDSLRQLIARADINGLKESYTTSTTDLEAIDLKVSFTNGKSKTIKDYGPSGPEKLRKIYRFISSLRDSQSWKTAD